VLRTFCDHDPARLAALDVRFAAPALPGETLLTEFWRDGDVVSFRTRVAGRDAVALANGRAVIRG
jgi:acyl dehydratase